MNALNNTNLSSVTNQMTQPYDQSNQKMRPGELNLQDNPEHQINFDEHRDVNVSNPMSVDISNIDPYLNLSHLEDKDLKVAISKLRGQNEDLRDQLKDLSNKLTEVLNKSRSKQKVKGDKPQEFNEEILAKEIDNSKQQIGQYKKEIQQLKNRLEICSSEDRIGKLETILRQREQMLQDLAIENKNLQKINRDQEKELDAYYKEQGFEHKVNACTEEVTALKEKMREVQEVSRVNEKNFKKQQEYLTNLNHQYALVCEKIGVSTALTFTKPDELNDYLRQQANGQLPAQPNDPTKQSTAGQVTGAKITDPKKIKEMEDTLKDLKNKEDILQRQLTSLDRKNQIVVTKLKNEVIDIEKQCKDIEDKLQNKEKEISTLDKRVSDLKQVAKKNAITALDPPGKIVETEPSQPSQTNQVASTRKLDTKPLGSAENKMSAPVLKTIPKVETTPQANPQTAKDNGANKVTVKPKEATVIPTVRDVMGGRSGAGLFEFSDKDVFENLFSTKIVKLTVWLGETYINGIQASYKLDNSEDVVGNQHLAVEMKGQTKVVESLQIEPDDRISFIAGKYDEALVCLKFQTAKGKIKVFGNDKSLGEDFEIDMEAGEQPTLLFGALCKKKDTKGKEEIVLANIGFTLVKKQKQ